MYANFITYLNGLRICCLVSRLNSFNLSGSRSVLTRTLFAWQQRGRGDKAGFQAERQRKVTPDNEFLTPRGGGGGGGGGVVVWW